MKAFISVLIAFCVVGCASDYKWYLEKNISTRDALKRYDVWAETLSYKYKDAPTSNQSEKSVVIFKYPGHNYYIRSYDKEGSFSLFDFHGDERINHPLELAQESERVRGNNNIVIFAEFVK